MIKKTVKGFFVVIIKQYDDTMFGADYHYTPWCIADNKYCRMTRTDKIRKFSTYNDAKKYLSSASISNTHDRQLEIVYLTTLLHGDNENDSSQLINWIQISGEQDAQNFDNLQKESRWVEDVVCNSDIVFDWDSTEFHSIFKSATRENILGN